MASGKLNFLICKIGLMLCDLEIKLGAIDFASR